MERRHADVPQEGALFEAVQWTGDDRAWVAICDLHADSELVAFRDDDGTVSIEPTVDGEQLSPGDWIIKDSGAFAQCLRGEL